MLSLYELLDMSPLERLKGRLMRDAEASLKKTRNPTLRGKLKAALKIANAAHARMLEAIRNSKGARSKQEYMAALAVKLDNQDIKKKALLGIMRHVEGSGAHDAYVSTLESAKRRRKLADRTCPVCLKSFTPKRKDSVTCSNRCRQAQFRRLTRR